MLKCITPGLLSLLVVFHKAIRPVASTCYWPNGTSMSYNLDPNKSYRACNTTDNGDFTCCQSASMCTTAGYCINSLGRMYRGGCTTPNWPTPPCYAQCRYVSISTSSGLYPCPDINGTATERYCCEDRSNTITSNACCDTQTFELNIISGFSLFLPQGEISFGNATSPLSLSSAMSSSVVTPSTSAYALATSLAHSVQSSSLAQLEPLAQLAPSLKPDPSSKLPYSIGAGIGVPLAVLLFSAQSFILFREHRRRISVGKIMVEYRAANPRGTVVGTRDLHELHGRYMPRELECAHRQPGELYDGEIYEVGGSPRFREPPGNNSREDGERS